jgi:D-arabinose 1-dehydrogenase-like Zn-dependent alcohol dehydrogenase
MRAIVMRSFGGESVLETAEVDDPSAGPDEALVRVGAVEVSSTRDIATRTGHHPFSRQVSLPHVLGGDFAGVVEDVGAGVNPGLVGRRVAASNSIGCGACAACRAGSEAQCPQLNMLGIHRWGSYAELAVVPVTNLNEIPEGVSLADAAAMAATGPIALTQLKVGQLTRGAWMLVTGATGALGTMLAVLGNELGARVICLSRRPWRVPAELEFAARLDSTDPDLTESLLKLTPAGVAVAIDNVAAGDVFALYLPALAIGARVVISGAIVGPTPPVLSIPAVPFYVRSLSLLGVRTTTRADIDEFWRLVDDGLRLPGGLVHQLPLRDAAVAHAQMSSGDSIAHNVLVA